MRFLLFFIFISLVWSAGYAVPKTILMPVIDVKEKDKAVGIENLYLSPQSHQTPLIAFYGEDGKQIFVYDAEKEKVYSYEFFKKSGDLMESSLVSFVTFCWDQQEYGKFAVIFSQYGKKMIFSGKVDDKGMHCKKLKEISVKTKAFNYYKGILSFVDLDSGKIDSIGGSISFSSIKPKVPRMVISDFGLITENGEPYFSLRNESKNDNGIYRGKQFEKIVDDENIDELYPHYSPDGSRLGYIERTKSGTARVCLKLGQQDPVKSNFTFALEENAMLREYSRMRFIHNKLYYFIKTPDINSMHMQYGLFVLQEDGKEENFFCDNNIISKGDPVVDTITNKQGKCEIVLESPTVKNIIPFFYRDRIHYIFLAIQGYYKIKIEKSKSQMRKFSYDKVQSQVIVISEDWPCKE